MDGVDRPGSDRTTGGGYGCLLLSNAGSMFLPGSNLTNLIVLGHLHLSGGQFLSNMSAAAFASLVVTAAVIGALEHRSLRVRGRRSHPRGATHARPRSRRGARRDRLGGPAQRGDPRGRNRPSGGRRRTLVGKDPGRPGRNRRAPCPGPRRPLRGGRGPRQPGPAMVRTGRPAIASQHLGHGGSCRRLLGAGQTTCPPPPSSRRASLITPSRCSSGSTSSRTCSSPAPWPRSCGCGRLAPDSPPSIAKASRLGVVAVPPSMAAALGALRRRVRGEITTPAIRGGREAQRVFGLVLELDPSG
jgi:hypothetical protein